MIRARRHILSILLLPLLLVGGAGGAERPSEYQVKAAFLYKFARYVEWPEGAFIDPQEQIVVGVLGRDPFGELLDRTVSGKIVLGRQLTVRRFARLEDMGRCHILFIGLAERRRVLRVLDELAGKSVLTVGEEEWFAPSGGMIYFGVEDQRIALKINVGAVEKAGLEISSRLLRVAEVVGGTEGGKGTP